ncbi:K02A2.6-like [Cordylochernes scorpioides]|uniref:RNA-directed DNA polymerase n=1 Tax=Cordylochernes scorpioides TaxID=51811 RepID=A0ABY6LEI5_9ARAC|nr:K02A2.6-like [Cordylochernes scorpioides]
MVLKKPEESAPKKAKVTISAGKVMAIVFWDSPKLHLGGKHFANDDEVQAEANHWLRRQDTAWYNNGIKNCYKGTKNVWTEMVERLFGEIVADYAGEKYNDNFIKNNHTAKFLELVNSFGTLSYDDFEVLYTKYSALDSYYLDLFFDALEACGTNPAFMFGKYLIQTTRVTPSRAQEFIVQITPHIKEVTEGLLDEYYRLCDNPAVRDHIHVHHHCLFSFAHLVRDKCVTKPYVVKDYHHLHRRGCTPEKAAKYYQYAIRHFDHKDESEATFYVKLIGAFSLKESFRDLKPFIEGNYPIQLRTYAIFGLWHLGYYHLDQRCVEKYDYGGYSSFHYIPSNSSYIPRSLFFVFDDYIVGRNYDSEGFIFSSQGLDKYLDRLLGPEGPNKKGHSFFEFFNRRMRRDASSNVEKELSDIDKKLHINTRGYEKAHATIGYQLSHDYYHFNETDIEGFFQNGMIASLHSLLRQPRTPHRLGQDHHDVQPYRSALDLKGIIYDQVHDFKLSTEPDISSQENPDFSNVKKVGAHLDSHFANSQKKFEMNIERIKEEAVKYENLKNEMEDIEDMQDEEMKDSEAKPKSDGVNDSEAKPKGDGVKDSTLESLIRAMATQQRLMMDLLLRNASGIRVGRPVKMDVATFNGRNADPKIWIKVYEDICGNNGWVGDEARINGMRSYLTGTALLWFDNKFQDEEEYFWKDWKQEFICSFNENPIKQGKMRLGMPGLSEELLIIGIIHGLSQYMQEQLATAGVECKQDLLKPLRNIRPISEKNYSESRPSARTLGTVEITPDHFTESSDTGLLQAANDRNVSFLSKKLTTMGSPVPCKFTATEASDLVLEAGEQSIEIQAIVLPDMPFDLLIGKPTLKSLKVKWDFFTDQISFFSETGPNLVTRRDVEAKYPSLCKRTSPIISKFEVDFGLQENFRVVSAKPYQLENTKRNWLNVKIRSMLSEGIIRPSNSAFASPCIVIPKKNGDYRLCVDYRRINDETLLDPFPFPRIDDIINVFGGCRFFSKLDLKDGFWQLGVSENTRKYTAFVTPSGHYEFLKLPFGWKNSPAKFQRIMTTILGDLLGDKVVAYIDDICCGGYTQEDCSILTHRILERLNTAGLVLNLDKCQFCVPRVDLLGRVIDGDTKKIRAEVTEKVRNMKRPYNLRSLQYFTGLTNHFRAFIKDYAHIVRPLDKLKGKDVTFEWDSECETAFQKLIALITEEPILRVPDERLPFELSTDASYYGTGAILYQRDLQEKRCKQLRVISYYSYTFTKAEQNYSVTEKECLAVLKAVKHFRSYLESRPFVVHTDHRALTQLLSCGELRDRLARWQLFLLSFNIIINHRSGKELRDADALSRLCVSVPDKSDEQTFWLKHKALELEYDEQRKSYLVTPEQVPSILGLYHDDPKSGGHSGFWRTYYTIKNRFWWRNMKGDIRRYVQSCSTCQKFPKGWKCCLEAAVHYHNRHHNTYLGCSPWYKWKGTVPIVPADEELGLQLLRIETEKNEKQRHKYRLRTKFYYNRNRRRPADVKPGDSILVKHQYTGKQRMQTGPHVVTDVKMVDGCVKYVLYESERGTQSAHITNIFKFHHRPPGVPSQE